MPMEAVTHSHLSRSRRQKFSFVNNLYVDVHTLLSHKEEPHFLLRPASICSHHTALGVKLVRKDTLATVGMHCPLNSAILDQAR